MLIISKFYRLTPTVFAVLLAVAGCAGKPVDHLSDDARHSLEAMRGPLDGMTADLNKLGTLIDAEKAGQARR